MKKVLGCVSVLFGVVFSCGAWCESWYVDGSVSASGDGTSWATAFKTIQQGIDAAAHGDEVIVAEGTYLENVDFKGKNIVLRSTDPTDLQVVRGTIIDGNQLASVVTFLGSETEECVLSGFTIRNGKAVYGGGIYSAIAKDHRTRAAIENNIISGNSGQNGGGLADCEGTIRNNLIESNTANYQGGGLFECHGVVERNTIKGNSSSQGGGLSYCRGIVRGNTITGNMASGEGGGLSYSNATLENNVIAGNRAGRTGGGLWSCGGEIRNNTISVNLAAYGGGMAECGNVITSCIIWGNLAPQGPNLLYSSEPKYSCIGEWEGGGVGNISTSPHFVDARAGNYRLRSWSPCIDAGDPALDFSNEPEPNGGRINMGAYGNTPEAASAGEDSDGDSLPDEWEMAVFGSLLSGKDDDTDGDGRSNLQEYYDGTDSTWAGPWYVGASVATSGDGTSWQTAFKTIQEGIDSAWERETVIVAPGTYDENIRFRGKNIKLRSTDPRDSGVVAQTIIDGGEAASVVTFVGTETGECVLSGFTIQHGYAAQPPNERGGGICGGYESFRTGAIIEDNVIRDNYAWDGGGIVYCGGIIRNNVIAYNMTQDDGAGIHRCSGLIVSNRIFGNSAGDHGGGIAKSDATIKNNFIYNNTAGDEGGGLRGCTSFILSNTIVGNTARYGDAMALCEGVIRDCIIWGGTRHGVQLFECSMPTYSCIDRWRRGGEGNINDFPYFVDVANGDFHLQTWSPCIDAGHPDSPFSNEPDPNGSRINMGAYGNTAEATSKSLDTDDDLLPDEWEMKVFWNLARSGEEDADGDLLSNGEEYRKGLNPIVALPRASWHVKGSVPVSGDGTAPAMAFKTIQEGMDAATDGDTVIVSPGIYVENIEFNGKNIVLRSTDPSNPSIVASTIIEGAQLDSVVAFLGSEDETCELAGFTIRDGSALDGGGICGGMEEEGTHATIRNNHIVGNSAIGRWDPRYSRWEQGFGGGIAFCNGLIAENTISDDWCRYDGGGLYGCDGAIQNNTIFFNWAERTGGGLQDCDGTVQNNLIAENHAGGNGGGLSGCDGAVQNNTIVDNFAAGAGGGLAYCYGAIRNCIIWGNTGTYSPQVHESHTPSFSCIEEWTENGQGNIPFTPQFVDAFSGNYRLLEDSPCVDAGVNFYWFAWPQRDLDGHCRLAGNRVDMGCYEFGSSPDGDGDLLPDQVEMSLAPNSPNPTLPDSDGDGLRDGLEVLRGTEPMVPDLPGTVQVPSDTESIQKALCLAFPGDEIVVALGAYVGNIQFCGTDVVLRSTEPTDPDVVAATILAGGGAGTVVSFVGCETADCALAGFTIRNGHADHGAGIRGGSGERRTLATIRNNVVTANSALATGAGVAWCDGLIENNTISHNNAGERGGGLTHCQGAIRSNTIIGNQANWVGSGLFECSGTIEGNFVVGGFGGGLADCDGTIRDNVVTDHLYGAGMFNCDGKITNNIIAGNVRGSGLEECDGMVLNNLIVGNQGPNRGGGLALCNGIIQNNTVAFNWAQYTGGGLYECLGSISNCILWANQAGNLRQIAFSSEPAYSCIQDWSGGGEGNIAGDPLFTATAWGPGKWAAEPTFDAETFQTTLVDDAAAYQPGALAGLLLNPSPGQSRQFVVASNSETTIAVWGNVAEFTHANYTYMIRDYRLSTGSPCIDAGRNDVWMWGATDLDGNPRIFPGASSWEVDIGAYEQVSAAFQAHIRGDLGGIELVWTSQPGTSYGIWSCADLLSGEWVEEATVVCDGAISHWSDPGSGLIQKFYRIIAK
jgi:hypothetical protein